ncbi:precorrin-6Y C5,15-methyltransferase (decarboxylating) [Tissierella praeacuta DSM 18095]|uniref:Precorrin-6Y C5,15-methyltransferase (Decarboxylating) n=1 Tax=Tissierella praeacuta DSM 18095 TaxID=1123404 RepID=A0A1M4WWJ5_9FIRM|nr:precorrin-6y C5,15-methyltransferase (decarboxylating) subunit CbiE [Tissierella praeacuta]SHE85527.1 precorrin-6Y C5,15-methyltransferase (decarboxylating) [Tissierella praeacuta DSM 18095]SUP00402.1 Probable cobalt-precorrin-6Y C(5)-methyltransferase [Tissierella praeacuta]
MLTVAGVGPGNPKYLTCDVKMRIENAKHILAFGRVANSLKSIRDDIIEINKVEEIMKYIDVEKELLLLASGDPNFFGIVDYLKKKGLKVKEVLPGLSSFQYMMGKLQKSWQGANFLSLHGRNEDLDSVKSNKISILLVDKDNSPNKISKELYKLNIKGKIYVGFNLSYDDEKIIIKNIGEEIENVSFLGVVVVENEMG